MLSDDNLALEMLLKVMDGIEAGVISARQLLKEKKGVCDHAAVKEETFTCLKFEAQQGAKIGEYEVAHKANNLEDKWSPVYNILRQNNATIASRYHGEGYEFGYWLYGTDKIYRQRLKPKQT